MEGTAMTPEEQLQVVDAMAETLKDSSADVRREGFRCLVGLGLDGLSRIVDVVNEPDNRQECKLEAVQALGMAFGEGKVDRTKMTKEAIKVLQDCLANENEQLCEAAVVALGEIGSAAINGKPKLLELLTAKKGNNRLCAKVGTALLKISPLH
jgi:HEAT repeat protein